MNNNKQKNDIGEDWAFGDCIENSKIEDAVPAQVLLEAGNNISTDCRHELELLDQSGSHQPNECYVQLYWVLTWDY